MSYLLPTSVIVSGVEYAIRSDYRAALDIHAALNDPDLEPDVRAYEVLHIFYPEADEIPPDHHQEAVDMCFWFLGGGRKQPQNKKAPKLVDWDKDFPLIVSPVNKVIGGEIRSMNYLHWWTFLSAYNEIGDCLFSQIVSIRDKQSRGKILDKSDREFYRQNKDIIDIKNPMSDREADIVNNWLRGGGSDV